MSLPRTFKSHAISYKDERMWLSACSAFICSLTFSNFASILSPAYFSSNKNTGSLESGGLSVQIRSTRSSSAFIVPCFSSAIFRYSSPVFAQSTRPSQPIHPFSFNLSLINSVTVQTPSSPIRYSVTPLPSNCFAACIKYLPSVQSPASSCKMTAVPAEPVNPVIYSLALKYSPTYSEP